MTEEQAEKLRLLVTNLEAYCAHCLRIKDKDGAIRPFTWNRAQKHIHAKLEEQRERIGMVRALVLKARQQGASTLIGARFYHRAATTRGKSVFVLAHEQRGTDNLYEMVRRFQQYNPLAPHTGATNAKELVFDLLDGGYKLATAGTKDVGRSHTTQLLHGSEVAFWANMHQHLAGIGNTVPDVHMNGSEVILESTANGIGNPFHAMWQDAEAGLSEYIPIFVPWFWSDEYRAPVRPGFELSPEDVHYQEAYGLDLGQMQWRANKIASYGAEHAWLFSQEFPASAPEAFRSPTGNSLVSAEDVMAAVSSRHLDPDAPLVIGCDPAGDGDAPGDRTAIAFRRGRVVPRIEYHAKLGAMQVAGKLAEYNRDMGPSMIFIDKGGLGAGIFDRLRELSVPVMGVNAAERAREPELYENRRAEMWWTMAQWLADRPCRIPNDPALISDLCAPQPDLSSNGRRMVEKKDRMKRRGVRSPDGGDAVALTFAEPVVRRYSDADPFAGARTRYKPATRAGY